VKDQTKNQAAGEESLPQQRSPLEWMRWIPALLLALVVIVALFISSQVILLPLLSSLALASMLEPVVEWFERRGWSRSASVRLTLTAASLVTILVLLFLLPGIWEQLTRSYEKLPLALQAGRERVEPLMQQLKTASPPVYEFLRSLTDSFRDPDKQKQIMDAVAGWMRSGLLGLVSATSTVLDLLLVPFFVYYLLVDYRAARVRLSRLIPPRHRATATGLMDQINFVVSSYVRSQLLIATMMGFLYALGFAILRVPLAFTLGLLSGLLNFVPYLGTLTGLLLSLSFTALDGAGLWRLVGVLIVFVIVQSIEGYYLTPKLMGEKLNLHPLWVLAGLVIAGNLFGLLGIILAVPVIAIAKVLLGFLEELYQKSYFYRRAGLELLTAEGSLVELTGTAELKLPTETSPIILEESPSERQRRIILTTGELRSRQREKNKPPPAE
jgi:predicted PurR-regulated permease PerM